MEFKSNTDFQKKTFIFALYRNTPFLFKLTDSHFDRNPQAQYAE